MNLEMHKGKGFGTKVAQDKIVLLMMALPSFICLIIFAFAPIYGWVYAFFNYKIGIPLSQTTFVGLKFFKIAFRDKDLLRVLVNTLAMSFLSLTIIPVSALFAILLSELRSKKYGKFLQIATTLPNFMSWIIVFSVFSLFLSPGDGILNKFLVNFNFINEPLNPLGNADITWIFQTGIKYWKELGYNAIIFFAAIAGIDSELYEAASIDGANRFKKILHITIPGIVPTVVVILLISIGFILSNGFDQCYVFYNGLVSSKIEVLDYYVYRMGLANNDIPYATAVSVAKTFISVFLVFSANFTAKKIRGESII